MDPLCKHGVLTGQCERCDDELRGFEAGKEAAAKTCDSMVVGGRAWTSEQAVAADALLTAAQKIRALQPPAEVKGERITETWRCVFCTGDHETADHQPPRAGVKWWVRTRLGEHELSSGCKVYEPDDVGDFEPGDAITIAPTADIDRLLERQDTLVRLLREAIEDTGDRWALEAAALLATIDKETGHGT